MNNIKILVQARMSSTRLPGKVLLQVLGKPVIVHQLERISRNRLGIPPVVITSSERDDDVLYNTVINYGYQCLRGSKHDLLDRHYQAGKKLEADAVCKIPSDCPFADPEIIADVLELFIDGKGRYDYVSNYHPPTFPDGLDVEVASMDAITKAWKVSNVNHEREHTFPYIWDNPALFSLGNIENSLGNQFMTHRWTLDYPDDWLFVCEVLNSFGHNRFSRHQLLDLLGCDKRIAELNSKWCGVNWYRHDHAKLKTVDIGHFLDS